jgi:hypothetical protein
MSFWKWSKTAAANATADTSINWAEGQAPSSVNDSARAMMAAAAKFRDDTAGALATGGTSAAYAVASNQVFDSLANMNGAVIAFVRHVSNGGPCTLNVDGLTAKPVRAAPGVDLGPGVQVAGTPYAATYPTPRANGCCTASTAIPAFRSAWLCRISSRWCPAAALHFRPGRRSRARPIRHCSR